jgi:tRNA (guanine-N7-)-methyltransferase
MQNGVVTVERILCRLASVSQELALNELFPSPRPIEVELGSGDGSFLMQWARLHPESNLLGIERLMGRIRKLERKGGRMQLRNLRGIRVEATYFMRYLLPAASISALHVYFPDPWPKRRHHIRRLVNEGFPALAARALKPGGTVFLRTDDAAYFQQMQRVFGAAAAFAAVETPPELAAITTDFEAEFLAKGISARRAAYRLNTSPGAGAPTQEEKASPRPDQA